MQGSHLKEQWLQSQESGQSSIKLRTHRCVCTLCIAAKFRLYLCSHICEHMVLREHLLSTRVSDSRYTFLLRGSARYCPKGIFTEFSMFYSGKIFQPEPSELIRPSMPCIAASKEFFISCAFLSCYVPTGTDWSFLPTSSHCCEVRTISSSSTRRDSRV